MAEAQAAAAARAQSIDATTERDSLELRQQLIDHFGAVEVPEFVGTFKGTLRVELNGRFYYVSCSAVPDPEGWTDIASRPKSEATDIGELWAELKRTKDLPRDRFHVVVLLHEDSVQHLALHFVSVGQFS
jgi:hypothetical protein